MLVLPEECCGGFLGDYFWFLPVFSAIWFDSGYMCLSVFGVGLAGCDAPRAVFLLGLLHHGRYGPAGAVCVLVLPDVYRFLGFYGR